MTDSKINQEEAPPCKKCGVAIFNSELFCNYCGQENDGFDLNSFNFIMDNSPFTSTLKVKEFCINLAGGKHDGFLGRAERMLEGRPKDGPMLFCENCGKKVLDFVDGKLVEIK